MNDQNIQAIRDLIVKYQGQQATRETSLVITHLQTALLWAQFGTQVSGTVTGNNQGQVARAS